METCGWLTACSAFALTLSFKLASFSASACESSEPDWQRVCSLKFIQQQNCWSVNFCKARRSFAGVRAGQESINQCVSGARRYLTARARWEEKHTTSSPSHNPRLHSAVSDLLEVRQGDEHAESTARQARRRWIITHADASTEPLQ